MGPDSSGPDAAGFGPTLARRVRPRRGVHSRRVSQTRPGALARRINRFGASLGLSLLGRWGLERSTNSEVADASVRPPVDYWPWPDPQDEPAATQFASGNRRVDQLAGTVLRRTNRAAPKVRRGIPIALLRGGTTLAGAMTAPGGIARRIMPDVTDGKPSSTKERPTSGRASAAAPRRAPVAPPVDTQRSTASQAATSASPAAGLPRDLAALQRTLARRGMLPEQSPPGDGGRPISAEPTHAAQTPTASPSTRADKPSNRPGSGRAASLPPDDAEPATPQAKPLSASVRPAAPRVDVTTLRSLDARRPARPAAPARADDPGGVPAMSEPGHETVPRASSERLGDEPRTTMGTPRRQSLDNAPTQVPPATELHASPVRGAITRQATDDAGHEAARRETRSGDRSMGEGRTNPRRQMLPSAELRGGATDTDAIDGRATARSTHKAATTDSKSNGPSSDDQRRATDAVRLPGRTNKRSRVPPVTDLSAAPDRPTAPDPAVEPPDRTDAPDVPRPKSSGSAPPLTKPPMQRMIRRVTPAALRTFDTSPAAYAPSDDAASSGAERDPGRPGLRRSATRLTRVTTGDRPDDTPPALRHPLAIVGPQSRPTGDFVVEDERGHPAQTITRATVRRVRPQRRTPAPTVVRRRTAALLPTWRRPVTTTTLPQPRPSDRDAAAGLGDALVRTREITADRPPAPPPISRRLDAVDVVRDHERSNSEPARATPRVTATSIRRDRVTTSNVASNSKLLAAMPNSHADDIGERFLTELARHRPARPQALPARFRPLASAIVGDRPVRVADDRPSRHALRSVAKVAATTGDTIHLDRPVSAVPTEVLAHELAHVAHPSPAPRFFADDRHTAEERRAEQVGAVMRRAPILPRTTSAGDTVARMTTSVAPAVARLGNDSSAAPGTVSASALAAQISGSANGSVTGVIQRWKDGARPRTAALGSHRASAPARPSQPKSQPPVPAVEPEPEQPPSYETRAQESSPAEQPSSTTALANFDQILELLEERIISELERRGGRFRGGF